MIDRAAAESGALADIWFILRTSGARTLPLAESLSDAGITVWTPQRTIQRRRPRSKIKVVKVVPIMPTFVFAGAAHVAELAAIAVDPVSKHPRFSVLRYMGRVALVAGREIETARAEEERWQRVQEKTRRHRYPTGATVRVKEGAAAGMSGIVEESDGQFAVVCFGGAMRFKIASWLLIDGNVNHVQPIKGIAA